MDIAVDYVFRVFQDIAGIVGKYKLDILPEALVILDIIHPGERMDGLEAELLAEFLLVKAVRIRVDLFRVHLVHADQMVPHLIRRIRELHIKLLAGHTERPQHNRETISGEDRKNDSHVLPAKLLPDIFGNLPDCRVIPLRTGHHSLRDADHVLVLDNKAFLFRRFEQAVPNQGDEIVSFFEDRHDNSSGGYSCVPHFPSLAFL